MLLGSLPREVSAQLLPIVEGWAVPRLYVGCSGDFPIHRALVDLKAAQLGNGTDLFTASLGLYLAGQPVRVQLHPDHEEGLAWLRPYLTSPEEVVATIRILGDHAEAWLKREANGFHARMAQAFQQQFPTLQEKVAAKVQGLRLRLEAYHVEDPLTFQRRWAEDGEAGFVCAPDLAPPEAATKYLDSILEWADRPEPVKVDLALLRALAQGLQGLERWALITRTALGGDMEDRLRGTVQMTPRAPVLRLYAGATTRRQVVVPHQKVRPSALARASAEDLAEKGARLAVVPLDLAEFNGLRSAYLNPSIRPGAVTAGYAVLMGGKLVGVYAISTSMKGEPKGVEPPSVYLMTDFSVLAQHGKASKLVVMAATSKEARLLYERVTKYRVNSLVTTAFSKKPVSMKYRNVLTLLSRKEAGPEDKALGFEWSLNYGGPIGELDLEQLRERWEALRER